MEKVRVLVALDFSECSRLACAWVLGRTAALGVEELIFHHVVEPSSEGLGALEKKIGEVRRFVTESGVMPPEDAVEIRYSVSGGKPSEEILSAARTHRAEIIVMGTNGRTGLDRLLVGSVAESVVRNAPCTVIVVKPGPD
jgi:nucleotide-binding universal stress UspA family protein